MNYTDLAELWKSRRLQYQEWQLCLLHSPKALCSALEAKLAPPAKTWKELDANTTHPYVEIVDFYGLDKAERKPLGEDAITPEGFLIFGISVTFDHGVQSYPKQAIYVPAASKLTQNGVEFALFDTHTGAPEVGSWTKDAETFCQKLIGCYKEYLSHDPHSGFSKKTKIGFV